MTELQYLISKMTDTEVAYIGGVNSTQAAKNWKAGARPNTDALLKFSEYFGKTINELLKEHEA